MILKHLRFIGILNICLLIAVTAVAQQKMELPEGMAAYYVVFLKAGANRNQPAEEAEKIQAAHLAHLRKLVESEKLVCVGPLAHESEIVGISIFQTETQEEAMKLAEADPAVQSGRVVLEIHPWWGPAGLGKGYAEQARQKPLDQMEFDQFQLGLIYRGDKWTPEKTAETQKIQEAHLANNQKLADEGKLIAAGPFTDGGDLRGIFVFTAASIEEAKKLSDADPAVQAGRLKVELHPWMVTKGVIPPVKK